MGIGWSEKSGKSCLKHWVSYVDTGITDPLESCKHVCARNASCVAVVSGSPDNSMAPVAAKHRCALCSTLSLAPANQSTTYIRMGLLSNLVSENVRLQADLHALNASVSHAPWSPEAALGPGGTRKGK